MTDEDELFDFDFACCLEKAADLLPLRFQKEHAKRKYGDENVFSTTIPSLRLLAEKVYSVSIQWFIQEGAKYAGADTGPYYKDAIHDFSYKQGYQKEVTDLFEQTRAQVAYHLHAGVESVKVGTGNGMLLEETHANLKDPDVFFEEIGGVNLWRNFLERKLKIGYQLHPRPLKVIPGLTKRQTTVKVFGLQAGRAVMYNGALATLLTNRAAPDQAPVDDVDDTRVQVALTNGQTIAVKVRNLRLAVDSVEEDGKNSSGFCAMLRSNFEMNSRSVDCQRSAKQEVARQRQLLADRQGVVRDDIEEQEMTQYAAKLYRAAYEKFYEAGASVCAVDLKEWKKEIEQVMDVCEWILYGRGGGGGGQGTASIAACLPTNTLLPMMSSGGNCSEDENDVERGILTSAIPRRIDLAVLNRRVPHIVKLVEELQDQCIHGLENAEEEQKLEAALEEQDADEQVQDEVSREAPSEAPIFVESDPVAEPRLQQEVFEQAANVETGVDEDTTHTATTSTPVLATACAPVSEPIKIPVTPSETKQKKPTTTASKQAKAATSSAAHGHAGATATICPDCGEQLAPGTSLKKHLSQKCKLRLVKCPNLGCNAHKKQVQFQNLQHHLNHECAGRSVTCEVCQLPGIRFSELQYHQENTCEMRIVSCPQHPAGCGWQGPVQYLPHHEQICPYAPHDCLWCFERMPQWQMASHRCQKVDAEEKECSLCYRKYSDLLKDDIVPAILVYDNKKSCLCKDPAMLCTACAQTWVTQGAKNKAGNQQGRTSNAVAAAVASSFADQINASSQETGLIFENGNCVANCPFCQQKYNGVSGLARHLVCCNNTASSYSSASAQAQETSKEIKASSHNKATISVNSASPSASAKKKKQKGAAVQVNNKTGTAPAAADSTTKPLLIGAQSAAGSFMSHDDSRNKQHFVPPTRDQNGGATQNQNAIESYAKDGTLPASSTSSTNNLYDNHDTSQEIPASDQDSNFLDQHQHDAMSYYELPSKAYTRPNTLHWISPLHIRFAHDSVHQKFADCDDWRTGVHLQDQGILDTMEEVLDCDNQGKLPKTLDCLEVCWDPRFGESCKATSASSGGYGSSSCDVTSSNILFVAGTGNRRLAMWRMLAIFRPERFARILVKLVSVEKKFEKSEAFRNKFTTFCDGKYVQIRNVVGNRYCQTNNTAANNNSYSWPAIVGRAKRGEKGFEEDYLQKEPGVTWDEAVKLIELKSKRTK